MLVCHLIGDGRRCARRSREPEETAKKQKMINRYAQIVGVGLLLLGGACMLGIGTTNPAVDLDHLFVGGILAYAGFGDRDEQFARTMVGGLGMVYLLLGMLTFVVPALFGVFPDTQNGIILNHLVHLVVGVSNIAAVALLPQDTLLKRFKRRLGTIRYSSVQRSVGHGYRGSDKK